MGNFIIRKKVVMVITGLEGKGLEASEGYCISGAEKLSFFFLHGKQYKKQTESELLRDVPGCRPKDEDSGRQHRPASQGLLEQCFCREVQIEGVYVREDESSYSQCTFRKEY